MNVGDFAPEVLGTNQDGKLIKLEDFKGKKLVLYFYPKDLTPGCTLQACNLRDNYEKFLENGYQVLGVSINDEKTHQRFISKHSLPFDLIADTESKLASLFGVWKEKKLYGRTFMGIYRTTFIIDETGIIERIISPKEIKVKDHAKQILSF